MTNYLAAIQMDCIVGDIKQNTTQAIRLLENLLEKEPDIVLAVFPEMALYGYGRLDELRQNNTQNAIDFALQEIATVCIHKHIAVVIGAPYFKEDCVENALYYISENGAIWHVYSKVHLIEAEQPYFQAGKTYCICETPIGKLGFLICWDSAFCEPARLYAKAGIDLLVVSAAWESPYERQWELAVCGRSFDNSLPMIASNRVGTDESFTFFGNSVIADCMGNSCTKDIGNQESFVFADVDEVLDTKKRNGFGSQIDELQDETYQLKHIQYLDKERGTDR